MREAGRKKAEKKSGGDIRLTPEPVFLLAGIWGILLSVRSIEQISFSGIAAFGCTLLTAAGLYILFLFRKKWILAGCAAALAGICVCLAVRNRIRFLSQIYAIADGLTGGTQQDTISVDFAVLICAETLTVIFFVMEMLWKRHWILYLLMTVLMAGIPVFGIPVGMAPAVLCLVFQILFWAIHVLDGRRFRKTGVKRQQALTVRVSGYLCGLLAVLIVISCVIISLWGEQLSGIVYSGEGFVSRSLQQISGSEPDLAADGYVSRGNNYRTGETGFRVRLSRQPSETLYLKGFTGGAYEEGEWSPADDNAVIHQAAQILGWEEWETWVGNINSYLYFVMNGVREAEAPEARSLSLEYVTDADRTRYLPYYNGRFQEDASENGGYTVEYYEQNEVRIDWEAVPEELETGAGWYRAVQEAYMQAIPEAYTQVPEEQLPRLTQMCRNHPAASLNEATAYIIEVLQSQTSYTLTPGRAPLNEDIVEYFLFDSHEGYCVHFASAATLMYRMFGFPARYASGYALQPADFVQQQDGSWAAEVTDESAHAWTEIFLEDYGWTPVEVTPASDGSWQTSYPGLDVEALKRVSAAQNPQTVSDERPDAADASEADRTESPETDNRERVSASDEHRNFNMIYVIIPAAGIFVILLLGPGRRNCVRRKTEKMNCREVFGRLLRLLHRSGLMSGYTGTEKEFAQKLAAEIPCLEQWETERLVEIAEAAAYGPQEPDQEEDEFVRRIYFRAESWIRKNRRGK